MSQEYKTTAQLTGTVTVVVVNGNARLVDRDLFEVGASVAVELGVKVREETALEQGVF